MREFFKRLLCIVVAVLLVSYLIPDRTVYAAGWTITSHAATVTVANGGTQTIPTINTGDTLLTAVGADAFGGNFTGITTNGGSCTGAYSAILTSTFTGGYYAAMWAATGCSSAITGITISATGGTWDLVTQSVGGIVVPLTTDGTNTASGASDGGNPSTNAPSVTTLLCCDFVDAVFNPTHSCSASSSGAFTYLSGRPIGNAYLTSNSAVAGTYGTQFTCGGPAAFSALILALKSTASIGASTGFPIVIKYQRNQKRSPADNRKHKLRIVSI